MFDTMYDKVKLFLPRTRAMPDITNNLDNVTERLIHSTNEVLISGKVGGLSVKVGTGGISVMGSLPKFLYNNNIVTLDRENVVDAMAKLSESIHIDVGDAKVTMLEFGANFNMQSCVANYLTKMGDAPRLIRSCFTPDTLYYVSRGRFQPKRMCFYDKVKEVVKKGGDVPIGMQDANLLRYEMRLNGRLPQQIGFPDINAGTLSDERLFRLLKKKWHDMYFSITKNCKMKEDGIKGIATPKDAMEALFAKLVSQSDSQVITNFLDEIRCARVLDRQAIGRLRKKLKDLSQKASLMETDQSIKELDDYIRQQSD